MRTIDKVLQIIREHPEGITTLQIGKLVYPDYPHPMITSNIYSKALSLAKFGLVTREYEVRPNARGSKVNTAVWRPIE